MVLPTKELLPTLTPFTILTSDDDDDDDDDDANQEEEEDQRKEEVTKNPETMRINASLSHTIPQSHHHHSSISGTQTLPEARLTKDDIDRNRTSGFGYYNNYYSSSSRHHHGDNKCCDDDKSSDGYVIEEERDKFPTNNSVGIKDFNNFLTNNNNSSMTTTSEQFLADLKSKFILLRCQTNNCPVNNKTATIEKLTEPRLTSSPTNAIKTKLLKMKDAAKIQALDKYKEVTGSLSGWVGPLVVEPLREFGEIVGSGLVVGVVLPFFVVVVGVLVVLRGVVAVVLRIRYKDRYTLMCGTDSAWASQSPHNDSSFLSLYVIQGDCSITRIRDRILKSVINCQDGSSSPSIYSRLRSRITEKLGFYCWESLPPMDFCIDEHVRYITNDPSAVMTEEQVRKEIGRLVDMPMGNESPQWEILVVPKFLYNTTECGNNEEKEDDDDDDDDDGFGNFDTINVKKYVSNKKSNKFYTGNQYFALIWRINHAIMDGLSAANCLQHCIADSPVALSVDPLLGVAGVSMGTKMFMYLRMMVFGPRSLLRSMLRRDVNCFHGGGGGDEDLLTGPKSLGWSKCISLEAVKRVREEYGVSTTAVFAALVGGGLRSLAMRKDHPVPEVLMAGLTAAVLPYPDIRPRNRFTVAHLDLRLGVGTSGRERVEWAGRSVRRVGRDCDVLKNYGLIGVVGMGPKWICDWLMGKCCNATVVVSNVPGPVGEYTLFGGQRVVDIVGWNTIKGRTGIGVCLFSYAGKVRAGVIGDGSVLPGGEMDVGNLIEGMESEVVGLVVEEEEG